MSKKTTKWLSFAALALFAVTAFQFANGNKIAGVIFFLVAIGCASTSRKFRFNNKDLGQREEEISRKMEEIKDKGNRETKKGNR